MADEYYLDPKAERLAIQRNLLRNSIEQTCLLEALLKQQAEALALMKGLPNPEAAAEKIVNEAYDEAYLVGGQLANVGLTVM